MRLINALKNRFNVKPPAFAGLHIASSSLQLLQLSKAGDAVQVNQYAKVSLPADGLIAEVVKELTTQKQSAFQYVAMALPDNAVISKTIQVSSTLSEWELAKVIPYELEQELPYPLQELHYDFQLLKVHHTQANLVDVLLVATQKQKIEWLMQAISKADLQVRVIEVESYAIERACQFFLKHWLRNSEAKMVAILLLSVAGLTVMVWHHQQLVFSRSETIATSEPSLALVLLHLRRALQFFLATAQVASIEQFIVMGDSTELNDLAILIQTEFALTVYVIDVLNAENFSLLAQEKVNRDFLICFGLALRGINP